MDKNEILGVILKHLKLNVSDIEVDTLDTTRSMVDYGASSLDMVEVVSGTMRELKLKVPRTELSGLKNIGELVDVLYAAKSKSA